MSLIKKTKKKSKAGYVRMDRDEFFRQYAEQDYEFKYLLTGKISFGNKKLPKDTAIFNMGSGTDCPSKKLGLCEIINAGVKCYAISAEQMYPSVLPYRRRAELYWKSVTAEQFVEDFLNRIAKKRKYPVKRLRLNEAGDVWDQESFNKAVKIAGLLKQHGIRTYMYTARKDLNLKNYGELNVQGSGFMVTNNYKAVPHIKRPMQDNERECKCDCKVCNLCVVAKNKIIYVEYH